MKVFGYSISLNVLILIGILYLIMVVNALSGTCNREGLSSVEKNFSATLTSIVNPTLLKTPSPTTAANKYGMLFNYASNLVNALDDANLRKDASITLNKIAALKVV